MTTAFKHEDAAAKGKTSICSMFVVGTFVSLRLNGLNSQEVRSAPGTWSLWITWAPLKAPWSICL